MAEQRTAEWFAQRRGRVTGSNVGAILGVNPWRTADDVLRAMVREHHGAPSEFEGNQATAHGNFHEDGAIVEYTMETGIKIRPCGFFVHPEHDWLGASPDGLIGDDTLAEIKCPYGKRNDIIPKFKTLAEQPHYFAQAQIEMSCAQRGKVHFFQWTPNATMLEFVHIDHAWLADAIPKLHAFHARYLAELDNPDHLQERRKRLSGAQWEDLLAEYDLCSANAKRAEERQKEIIAELEKATAGQDAEICGRKFTRVVRAGAVSYAKVVKEKLQGLDLSPWTGKESSYWRLS